MKGWIVVNVVRRKMTRLGVEKNEPPTTTRQQVQVANINSFSAGWAGGALHMKNGERLNTTESYAHLKRLIGFATKE